MTLPTFLVIGAGRSGTTSLQQILGQHPDVFMCPQKSPNHFAAGIPQPPWETPVAREMAEHWVADAAAYRALFDGVAGQRAIGEVSPVYLQAAAIPGRIRAAVPDVRLVAVLRHPVDRAFAHWAGRHRDGIDPTPSFDEAVRRELAAPLPDDVAFGHYLGCGRYHHWLAPYVELFGRDALQVHLYDDLVAHPAQVIASIFEFVGVDPAFSPDLRSRLNASGTIRGPVRRWVWTATSRTRARARPHLPAGLRHRVGRLFLTDLDRPELDPARRAELTEVLRPDIEALAQLIDRDLSGWLA